MALLACTSSGPATSLTSTGRQAASPAASGLGADDAGRAATVQFRFTDTRINESSGLVARNGVFVTVNDSGDVGRIFTVDGTGKTVGVTNWKPKPRDTEAVAPSMTSGYIWVGDIGDNASTRSKIALIRVPSRTGTATVTPERYLAAYPNGPHNAETLLVQPGNEALYIVTKQTTGAALYSVPPLRSGVVNKLVKVAQVKGLITDGAFTPDGQHVLLRSYGRVYVYGFPSMQLLGSAQLPSQPQGEGLAIATDNTIYLSTEGANTPVLRYTLPPALDALLRSPARMDAGSATAAGLLRSLGLSGAADAVAAGASSMTTR